MNAGWIPYAVWRDTNDHTVSGTVLVWPGLGAAQLPDPRDILVYLPPSLAASGPDTSRRYPVLYFHDGQNVFDDRTSYSGEWHGDETLEMLAHEGIEAIAVAIPNGGDSRMDEYNPWRSLDTWRGRSRPTGGRGDAYLGFLVGHVKPLIDSSFPTRAEREATGIIGSSMGGLISMYALTAFPHVFGLAGVMSPSLHWNDHQMLEIVRRGHVPPARIHLDAGGQEWRGMVPEARRLRDLLVERGFVEGASLHYVEERHGTHNESAWARRLPDALRFLLADVAAEP